jgi:hypothetical protein
MIGFASTDGRTQRARRGSVVNWIPGVPPLPRWAVPLVSRVPLAAESAA